jgi:alpha-L-rhamnosidase
VSNIRGTYGSLGVIRGNPGQTEISDITLENIGVQLKSGKLMAGEVKNLKIENITINGKPFSSKIGE